MNLIPGWAPNLHSLVVHFPIALLLTAAGLDVSIEDALLAVRRTVSGA